jgi:hypothetical protein
LIFLIYYGISTFSVAADGDEATRLGKSDELKKNTKQHRLCWTGDQEPSFNIHHQTRLLIKNEFQGLRERPLTPALSPFSGAREKGWPRFSGLTFLVAISNSDCFRK